MTEDELVAELALLRARLQAVEDVEAIRTLHATFTRAVADRHFEALPSFFTDDAVIDMRRHGEKAGIGAIRQHFAGMESAPLTGAGYVLSSPAIEVAGDAAAAVWTWHRLPVDGPWQEGRYDCGYRRCEDGWRFARMHFRVVLPDHDDAAVGEGDS